MGIGKTDNLGLTTGRPNVPRIADENLRIIDLEIASALAYPFVPNAATGRDGLKSVGMFIKSLEAGPYLTLTDQGDGQFIVNIDLDALAKALMEPKTKPIQEAMVTKLAERIVREDERNQSNPGI